MTISRSGSASIDWANAVVRDDRPTHTFPLNACGLINSLDLSAVFTLVFSSLRILSNATNNIRASSTAGQKFGIQTSPLDCSLLRAGDRAAGLGLGADELGGRDTEGECFGRSGVRLRERNRGDHGRFLGSRGEDEALADERLGVDRYRKGIYRGLSSDWESGDDQTYSLHSTSFQNSCIGRAQ